MKANINNNFYENKNIDKSINIYANNNKKEKDEKQNLLNNPNNIKSINIINNYNNIVIKNKLTPNKKLILGDKTFSMDKKKFTIFTLGNRQKNLKKEVLKLTMKNQNKDKENNNESKYKLIINEKNNLIKKLKNEIEYYKNQNQKQSNNLNLNITNNNTIPTSINYNKGLENIKNKITIFSQQKKELNYDNNNLINDYTNKNEYSNIKTNYNINSEIVNRLIPEIHQSNPININSIGNNNNYKYNKLISNYSLKNKLTLDLSNYYNSIETNSNRIYKNSVKSPKYLFTSNSINNNLKCRFDLSENNNNMNKCNAIINYERSVIKPSFKNLKKNKYYFNNILSTPFSLKKEIINKKIIDNHNLDSLTINDDINNISSSNFNYKEKFENLKIRFNNLLENVFNLIENQNNQNNQKQNNIN